MSQIEVKAIAKGIRISPRKVGVVADLIRRRSVADALVILDNTERKSAQPIIKLLNSAVANATNNFKLSPQGLEIKTIMVTEGVTMKRYKMVGYGRRGRPRPILKRSSHVTIVLTAPAPKTEAKTPAKPAASAKKAPVKKVAPKQANKEAKK